MKKLFLQVHSFYFLSFCSSGPPSLSYEPICLPCTGTFPQHIQVFYFCPFYFEMCSVLFHLFVGGGYLLQVLPPDYPYVNLLFCLFFFFLLSSPLKLTLTLNFLLYWISGIFPKLCSKFYF